MDDDRGPMEQAVAAAIAARPPAAVDARDAALVALALSYARLIDEPAPAGKYAVLIEWLQTFLDDADTPIKQRSHVRMIMAALSEHTVHSDLGPKLQATLESLRLSPRVRLVGKGGSSADGPAGPTELDELRAARARKRPGAALDAPTS